MSTGKKPGIFGDQFACPTLVPQKRTVVTKVDNLPCEPLKLTRFQGPGGKADKFPCNAGVTDFAKTRPLRTDGAKRKTLIHMGKSGRADETRTPDLRRDSLTEVQR